MQIEATEEQVKQIAANAVNASAPMGMGLLQFTNTKHKPEAVRVFGSEGKRQIILDYFEGRMVKTAFHQVNENLWRVVPDKPREDYQSWVTTYRTTEELVSSVAGVKIADATDVK